MPVADIKFQWPGMLRSLSDLHARLCHCRSLWHWHGLRLVTQTAARPGSPLRPRLGRRPGAVTVPGIIAASGYTKGLG